MDQLDSSWLRGMRELIFETVECVTITILSASKDDYFESYTNLLDWRVFEIFTKLERVTIYTTNLSGYKCYPFSILYFCEIIKSGNHWKRIEIVAACDKGGGAGSTDSWLKRIWESHRDILEAKYEENNFCVKLHDKMTQNTYCNDEDVLVITRG